MQYLGPGPSLAVDLATKSYSDGAAQTLTNKVISGSANTLSNIAQASVTNLTTDLAGRAQVAGSSISVLKNAALNADPESTLATFIPGAHNDMMFCTQRGGTVNTTKNGSAFNTPGSGTGFYNAGNGTICDAWFMPDSSFCNEPTSVPSDVYVITVTLPATISQRYGCQIGIAFAAAWYCRNVQIEVFKNSSWTSIYNVTNSTDFIHRAFYSGDATSYTQIRYTFSNAVGASVRITSLFSFAFNSTLLGEGFLPRNGGALYGTSAVPPAFTATGGDANIPVNILGKGTAGVSLGSGGGTAFYASSPASAVNQVQAIGAITGASPVLEANGTDANVTLVVRGRGTGSVSLSNTLLTTPATSSVNYWQMIPGATGAGVQLYAIGTDTNISANIYSKGTSPINLRSAQNGVVLSCSPTASGVNYFQMTSGATGIAPNLGVAGTDANIALWLSSKGTSAISLVNDSGVRAFSALPVASGVNYIQATAAATGAVPTLASTGSDTNVGLNLVTKGSSTVQANGVDLVTTTGTQTLTGKTISGASNTLSNIGVGSLSASGVASGTTYLRGDGVWATPAGGGGSAATGMLEPVQHHTLGDETFTIVSGSVTTIGGTSIQGQGVGVGDRILVLNANATSGTGSAYSFTTVPANGIYVVTALGTDMTVSRAADFSGAMNPAGLCVFSEHKDVGWLAQSIFAVSIPYWNGTFTFGTNNLYFRPVAGANIAADSVYVSSGRYGIWNSGASTSTYLYANGSTPSGQGEQSIYLPGIINGTLMSRSVVLVTGVLTFGTAAGHEYVYLLGSGAIPTLPTAVGNKAFYRVKNTTNSAITLLSAGGTIDGSTSISLRPNVSVDLVSDNTNWFVL